MLFSFETVIPKKYPNPEHGMCAGEQRAKDLSLIESLKYLFLRCRSDIAHTSPDTFDTLQSIRKILRSQLASAHGHAQDEMHMDGRVDGAAYPDR
jgi:hypothetical protein